MPRIRQASGGGTSFITGTVANYSALPTASEHNAEVWIAISGEGLWIVNRKSAGLYYSDGSSWRRLGNIPAYFDSGNFEVFDTSDNTKTMDVDVSNISTGTNKTITMPNRDLTLDNITTSTTTNLTGYLKGDGSNASAVTTIPASDVIYDGTETVEHILDDTINKGTLHDVVITDAGGLDITWASGGSLWDATGKHVIDIDAGSGTCTDGSINYLWWDRSSAGTTLTLGVTEPDYLDGDILVALITCEIGDIFEIKNVDVLDFKLSGLSIAYRGMFPIVVTDGLLITEDTDVTNAFDVQISAGTFYHFGTERHTLAAGFNTRTTAMTRWFHSGGNWTTDSNAEIDITQWDNGTNLVAVTANKYYKSMFMYSENMIHWIYPQVEYATVAQAIAAPLPTIPVVGTYYPRSTSVVLKGNDIAFPVSTSSRWADIRQMLGTSIIGTVTDHGNLAGLGDDDHTQYILEDGTRDLSGNWTISSNSITLTAGTLTAATVSGANVTSGEDPGHTHTGASLSGIDISEDTNLTAGTGITLTDDTLSTNDSEIDHNSLNNTHNLTTDIDHDSITNTHNLTSDLTPTATNINGGNWKVLYSDGSGDYVELALGAAGTALQSNGAAAAPTFEVAASDPLPQILMLMGA